MNLRSVNNEFFRFIVVGIFNTVLGTGMMLFLYNLAGFSYWSATSIAYIIGSVISFFLNKYFTFQKSVWSWIQVSKFIVNIISCYLLAYGIAKPLALRLLSNQKIRLQENIAILIGECLYAILNYLGQKFFTFREKRCKSKS